MIPSLAELILDRVAMTNDGYTPVHTSWVIQTLGLSKCEVFSFNGPIPSNGLWKSFEFPDGSIINLSARSCAIFVPSVGPKAHRVFPTFGSNTLY